MYRRPRSYSAPRDYKKDISQLQSLSALTLADLKKVRRYVVDYPERVKVIEDQNILITVQNKKIDRENEAATQRALSDHARKEAEKDTIRKPIRERQAQLLDYLLASKTWFGGFEADIRGRRYRLAHGAQSAYEEYLALEKKWSELRLYVEVSLPPDRTPHIAKKKAPADYTVLRIAGANLRLFYKQFSIEQIDAEIKKRETELQKDQDKIQDMRARAASKESETRAQAKKFKRDLEQQLSLYSCCPYCTGPLTAGNAHLDHIYPVSKGGLSTKQNLLFVCSPCNIRKKNLTLRAFVRENGYDFDSIAQSLETLGKDF